MNCSQQVGGRTVLPRTHRGSVIHLNGPSKNSLAFPLLEGHAGWSRCGRRTRPFSGARSGSTGPTWCPSNPFHLLLSSSTQSGRYSHRRAARWLLHCAYRTSTVSSCAFCEHDGWFSCPLHLFSHVLPLLRHLRFARHLALRWFRHHHGLKTPMQKRFGKGLRAPYTYFERLPP